MEHRAQGQFRLRVAAADAGHDLGTFLRGEDVHREINPEKLKTEMRKSDPVMHLVPVQGGGRRPQPRIFMKMQRLSIESAEALAVR